MADFCKACSIELFGKDHHDLSGLTTPEDDAAGLAALVICEGCGPIQVNSSGECISRDCSCADQPGHGVDHPDPPDPHA